MSTSGAAGSRPFLGRFFETIKASGNILETQRRCDQTPVIARPELIMTLPLARRRVLNMLRPLLLALVTSLGAAGCSGGGGGGSTTAPGGSDVTAPTISSVSSTTADGAYGAGSAINITVHFSEAVTSTGSVTVTLDTGRSCSFAVTNAASGSCTYTVQAGDTSADLTTTSLAGTIADQAGNAMTNFTPGTNLGSAKNIVIDTTAPSTPLIVATDFIAGPTAGGENGAGAYLTVIGQNFGSFADWGVTNHLYLGGCEVANYRFLQPVLGGSGNTVANLLGLKALGVQVGSLCGATAGSVLKIDMTVNGVHPSNPTDGSGNYRDMLTKYDGTSDSLTWTVQPGTIYFVDLAQGSDSNDGSFDHPFQHVQGADGHSGALRMANGDTTKDGTPPGTWVVVRGGNYSFSGAQIAGADDGWFVANLFRIGGTAPTGAANRGPICITSYPGAAGTNSPELVKFYPPPKTNNSGNTVGGGGFIGNDQARADTANPYDNAKPYTKWIHWSRIFISSSPYGARDAAPINLDSSCDYCRVINTELTWPWAANGDNTTNAAGIAGNGYHMRVALNYVHDIAGNASDNQNHGIYLDGSLHSANDVVVAFNTFRNLTAGNGVQTYDAQSDETLANISVHHNWVENAHKHGLNQGNMTGSAVWYDNIVLYSGEAGIRIVGADSSANNSIKVYNNTVYGWGRVVSSRYGYFDDGGTGGHVVDVRNNIFMLPAGSPYSAAGGFVAIDVGQDTFNNNRYFDANGKHASTPSEDSTGTYGNPGFTSAGTDFSLATGSACINAGSTPLGPRAYGFLLNTAPQGAAPDVGAYEYSP
jgi:hypothetical protein